ncbi:MAG: hydratase [Ruminococcaceae bacterium]|nr:hydratase [Oscillospiraceae bacterium]
MIDLIKDGVYLIDGKDILKSEEFSQKLNLKPDKDLYKKGTMAYKILDKHNTSGDMENLKIKFDKMASHDITYVGIIQTAKASGLLEFPIPYVLTNCHNSLCAVGGTINEDDHLFGLSAAKKYGGIYVPSHQAVIHQYMREMMAECGAMILGSDSHTRYGALGTMAIGEGGPELVKQLLNRTYDISYPGVIMVYLKGNVEKGVGPQDVALSIIKEVFDNGFVKNKIMEFVGPGIENLSVEFRNGIDVMTTETTCLSSIWKTDLKVKDYYDCHGRIGEFKELNPENIAYYDGAVVVDLSKIKPSIAMPFHPSNVYTIEELNKNLSDIIRDVEIKGAKQLDNPDINFSLKEKIVNGKLKVDQGVIAGCAGGTFDNLTDAADILDMGNIGNDEFMLSAYPSSQPVYLELIKNGSATKLLRAGVSIRTAFCGPCFGAGDVPANNALSIRHSTRNFPNREGSKPSGGQISSVALMDARSIAATAINGGFLTPATDIDVNFTKPKYYFDKSVYESRVYFGNGKADKTCELKYGPNIADWPKMSNLTNDLILKVVSVITDPVTTTDELIPSGETSSYRSNPLKLAEFALSRKDPQYVGCAKEVGKLEKLRLEGKNPSDFDDEIKNVYEKIKTIKDIDILNTGIGSVVYANKPGDGSAREQAASCQKVLGGWANIALEYATKRYRSNLINWGMLPFISKQLNVKKGDYIFVPDIAKAVKEKQDEIKVYIINDSEIKEDTFILKDLTDDERDIILSGCLINYYRG